MSLRNSYVGYFKPDLGSIINIGCLTGALLGGPLSERALALRVVSLQAGVGRKGALVLQGPLYAVVWAATSLAQSYSLLTLRLKNFIDIVID